ncbi:sulfurtransferase TusA family protein [Salinirubrum litoreum]|uniref:Sulfurtransferase TusA family protein n=1 Tax=Salinirubrum litoreum TaxID=1126234 RepID=A0ABD5RDL5_9EURY|nr:sulfurtransferase TusA family protein [Salinirubrum litoreum]
MNDYEPDMTVDSRGSGCPGPMMDLIGKIKTADPGAVVRLLTTERGSTTDVPEWLEKAGHELLDVEQVDDYWQIDVRKS